MQTGVVDCVIDAIDVEKGHRRSIHVHGHAGARFKVSLARDPHISLHGVPRCDVVTIRSLHWRFGLELWNPISMVHSLPFHLNRKRR